MESREGRGEKETKREWQPQSRERNGPQGDKRDKASHTPRKLDYRGVGMEHELKLPPDNQPEGEDIERVDEATSCERVVTLRDMSCQREGTTGFGIFRKD